MKHGQTTAAELSFDPSLYPRMYSASLKNLSWIAVAFVLAVGSTIILWRSHALTSQPKALVGPVFAVLLGYVLLRALTFKVILQQEGVTVRSAFSSRSLLRYEIAGWRATDGREGANATARTLVPRDDAKESIGFPDLKADAAFFAWFVGIPEIKPTNSNVMDTPTKGSILAAFLTWVGLMVAMMATFLLLILLDGQPFQVQIVSLIAETEFVFFLVFFGTNSWRGYSLRDKRVQREFPRLLRMHCIFLIFIFTLLTLALSVQARLPASWITANGPKDTPPFVLGLILIGSATAVAEAWIFRKSLRRAVNVGAAVSTDGPLC
jgi:hypothetical protein